MTDPTARALLVLLADLDRDGALDVYGLDLNADEPLQFVLHAWREAGYPGASEPEPEPAPVRPRLVWVRGPVAWYLCPVGDPREAAIYSAWPDGAVRLYRAGADHALMRESSAERLAHAALVIGEWAKEDGFEPDPWPGEVTP